MSVLLWLVVYGPLTVVGLAAVVGIVWALVEAVAAVWGSHGGR